MGTTDGVQRARGRFPERSPWGGLAVGVGRTCRSPGGTMYYRCAGDGPGLVLLHGLGGGSGYFEGLARELLAVRTCLAPDLLGFGRSAWPILDYIPEAHMAALRAVLADAMVEWPFDLVGHSVGGVLALDLARSLPCQVRTLTLLCTPYPKRERTTARQLWRREVASPGGLEAHRQQRRMNGAWPWQPGCGGW